MRDLGEKLHIRCDASGTNDTDNTEWSKEMKVIKGALNHILKKHIYSPPPILNNLDPDANSLPQSDVSLHNIPYSGTSVGN